MTGRQHILCRAIDALAASMTGGVCVGPEPGMDAGRAREILAVATMGEILAAARADRRERERRDRARARGRA